MSANQITLAAYTPYPWNHALARLRILGPAEKAGIRVIRGGEGENISGKTLSAADLVLIQRDFSRNIESYEAILAGARQRGTPVIFDLDDLLLELPDDHPDRAIHYYTNALVPMLHTLVEADAVTASSALLADYLREFNPHVWLLPNYLDDSLWPQAAQQTHPQDDPVVVGYMGGDSHLPDLRYITPVLQRLSRHYGSRVHFHFWGGKPPADLLALPLARWTDLKLPYASYAAYLREQAVDLAIAPLRDNLFNRCKSSVKALEYSALGLPAVYSRLPPYEDIIRHGESGFLAATLDEWESSLTRLIEAPELRKEMGTRAQEIVYRDWRMTDHAAEWASTYQKILATGPRMDSSDRTARVVQHMFRLHLESQRKASQELNDLAARLADTESKLQALRDQNAAFNASPTGRVVLAWSRLRRTLKRAMSR